MYRTAGGGRLPFADGSFDVVTFWNVVEHLDDRRGVVAEAVRVLAPGGRLFVLAPNYASFRREAHYQVPWVPFLPKPVAVRYLRRLGRDPQFFADDVHPVSAREVRRLLRSLGLEVGVPVASKLADPTSIQRPAVRRAVELVDRLGLRRAAEAALAAGQHVPFRRGIDVVAVKPG